MIICQQIECMWRQVDDDIGIRTERVERPTIGIPGKRTRIVDLHVDGPAWVALKLDLNAGT
jgi:hypothetical protein